MVTGFSTSGVLLGLTVVLAICGVNSSILGIISFIWIAETIGTVIYCLYKFFTRHKEKPTNQFQDQMEAIAKNREQIINTAIENYKKRIINQGEVIEEETNISTYLIRFLHAVKYMQVEGGTGNITLRRKNNNSEVIGSSNYCTHDGNSCLRTMALEGYLDYPGFYVNGIGEDTMGYILTMKNISDWEMEPSHILSNLHQYLPAGQFKIPETNYNYIQITLRT